ncbi:MAG: FAD-dependent monooxygenase [Burkholderiaceae bacterium]
MTSRYDVAIVGAGPVGMALALMLASRVPDPSRIALYGRASVLASTDARDPRTLALNEGSRLALDAMKAWPAHSAPIRNIHVSQSGRLGRTLIQHTDFNVTALGHVAHYTTLTDALDARLRESGISRRDPVQAADIQQDDPGPIADSHPVRIADTRARLVVVADGAGGADITRQYDQHAVLATARASQPRTAWAWERFRSEGPLAVLPHPAGDDLYAIVWCCRPETANRLQRMAEPEFSRALNDAFGDRLGTLHAQGERHVFPLALKARRQVVQRRLVAIGNAAQSLHPVAGQGLNLGLRDAAQLSQALAPWLADVHADASLAQALQHYGERRRLDRSVTGLLTDVMPRAFATGLAPVEHLCGAALLALDLSRTLRAPLARQLLYGSRR